MLSEGSPPNWFRIDLTSFISTSHQTTTTKTVTKLHTCLTCTIVVWWFDISVARYKHKKEIGDICTLANICVVQKCLQVTAKQAENTLLLMIYIQIQNVSGHLLLKSTCTYIFWLSVHFFRTTVETRWPVRCTLDRGVQV